jgi:hypothetical protein
MATGDYNKLLDWSKTNAHPLRVSSQDINGTKHWYLGIKVIEPVQYDASGSGESIDAAAAKIIADLKTVGAKVD